MDSSVAFQVRLKGAFQGMLHWQQLDELWVRVKQGAWYFYQIGEALPENMLDGDELARRIDALNTLLHRDHEYSYCGIVYVDDALSPTLIKVYDPNHIGSSCSGDAAPSPPGWILSQESPALIEIHAPAPGNRRRWWHLLST